MKTYTVRTELRTPVHCPVFCFSNSAVINGMVWDLSATGWRATLARPVPVGLEKSVFMTLRDGNNGYPIFIDAAIVRWTHGCEAAWEITRTDEWTRTRLTNFLERCQREDKARET